MRLIDADETIETLYACIQRHKNYATLYRPFENGCIAGLENAIKILKNGTPAIEAEPVRHSKWDENAVPFCNVCQECGAVVERHCVKRNGSLKRCPNCGAKMDSKEVEENDT